MPSLLDPEAYGFANPDEDRRKKLSAQDVMAALGGLLGQPVDYVKGRATSLLTDPIGDIQRTLQGTVERAKARDLLTQQAYGDPSNPLRVTDQAAADQLANEYLDMASTIMPMGMTVYHGSPYKFSAFDPTKIGSGEGAQAYGYGHYVAESPDVAKQYKADRSFVGKTLSGSPSDVVWDAQKIAKDAIDIHGENAIPHLEGVLRMNSASKNKKQLAENKITEDALALLKSNAVEGSGSFYKVDLPDEQISKMLDWDAELGKQSKEVQDLAKQYGLNMDDLGGDLVAAMDAKRPAGAEAMRQAGVPGIKYFDAQSRGGQKADTRNFVVFPKNEGLLKIEEVNGQPIQGGLLGGSAFDVSRVDASDIFGAGAEKVIYKDPNSGGYIQVLTRPDQPASILGLEVPEAFRKQGIGGSLQEQALKDFPNMQGQVSSKAAARSAYKLGRRPVGQPDATLDDVLKMIDEDSSVNLVSPARQQEIGGAQSGLLKAPQAEALAKAKAISGVDDPYTRSLQQGYEHDWYHGTTADIPSFDKGLLGETTGAQSAKKGFFFARDPQNPPASLTQKSSDPASIEMLKKLGIPDEEIAKLNSISMEGYGAETASGYANMGGSREYKEAMRKAKSAEKRGDWDEYAKQTEIAENAEISKSQELQSLVAKYGDARDEMLNDINNAYYGKKTYKLSQAEAEAMDAKYKQLMPYGWYNLYSVPQLKALKKEIANLSDVPEDSLKSIDKFISLKSERELAEKATEGGNVMPVALRYKNPMYHDFEGKAYREQTYNDLIQEAQQKGHDALILKNTYDPGAGPAKLIDVGVVFEPNQIRSKFAAFDPSKINEANILAGALPFGLLSGDEETQKKLRNLLDY